MQALETARQMCANVAAFLLPARQRPFITPLPQRRMSNGHPNRRTRRRDRARSNTAGASARPLPLLGATRIATLRSDCAPLICACATTNHRRQAERTTPPTTLNATPLPTIARMETPTIPPHTSTNTAHTTAEVGRTTTPGLSRQSHQRTAAPPRPRTRASGSHRLAPMGSAQR
jgi:hypothetical protein